MMFQVGKSEAAAVNQLTVMFDTNLSSGGFGMVPTEKDSNQCILSRSIKNLLSKLKQIIVCFLPKIGQYWQLLFGSNVRLPDKSRRNIRRSS